MSIKKHLASIFPPLLIPLLLVVIWFRNGLIVGGGDESFIFYNPQISLGVLNNTWQEYQTGFPFLAWISRANFVLLISILQNKFFIPNFFLQAASFYILMVVGVVSVYFLTRFFLNSYKNSHSISLVSAIFYLFNPFSVSQVWGRGLYAQYFSFALLPLLLLLFIFGLEKRRFIFAIFLAFSSVLFAAAFGFVTFIVVLWGILLLYLIYWVLKSKQKKKDLLFGTAFFTLNFAIWCLVSSWWLLPLIISGNAILAGYLENSTENLGTLFGVSRNFTPDIIVRLLQRTYYYDATAFSPMYKSFFFQLISFIPLVFVLIGFIKVLRNRDVLNFKFLLILLIIGLAVSLGANPPFGWLLVWLFEHVSLLQSFRNPFEKFGLVYALGYSTIFAFGLVSYFGNIRYKNFLIFIFLVITCGIFAWPMWNGKVVSFPNNTPGIDVPKYYQQLNNWLSINNRERYRVLMTPIWSGDDTLYQWNNTKYNGIDPMMFLLETPVVSSSPSLPYFYDFVQNIRKYMERVNVVPALGFLRAKYLVNRNDAIIESHEKRHYHYLTESIFSPQIITDSGNEICQNLGINLRNNNLAWIVCRMPAGKSDWSEVRYLHLTVKTSVAAYLELALTDQKFTRIRWDGRSLLGSEYKTQSNEWTTITFPLSAPTEHNNNIDFSKVLGVEIFAYPMENPRVSVDEIFIRKITLDSGLEEKINMFSLVNTFGNLQVYAPNEFNSPEEFGTLVWVSPIKDFLQLFEVANQEINSIDRKGYILEPQNSPDKLDSLLLESSLVTQDKYKFSNTKYWLKVNKGNEEGWLLLSKTFNPEWKVIPGVSRKMLEGNLFNDLSLLKRQVLPEKDHFVVNGYANLWKIGDDDVEYAIVFMPQIVADIGSRVSIFSIMLLIGITLVWQTKKYTSSH